MKKKAKVIPLIADDPRHPLQPKHAAILTKKLWRDGKVTWKEHGKQRKREREFDTLEVESLILEGTVVGVSGWTGDCWIYEIEDRRRTKRVVVALGRERLQIITIIRLGRP